MPLFVFVLAYNLARPGAAEQGAYRRTMIRLALFGVLATPAFIALGSLMAGWFPLNILFTLLVIAAVIALTDRARAGDNAAAMVAVLVFLVGGGLVEFWWPSVAFGVASWWVLQKPELDGPSGRRGGLFLALLDQRQSLGACGPAARCGGFPARPVPAATALGVLRLLPAAPGRVAANPHPYGRGRLLVPLIRPCAGSVFPRRPTAVILGTSIPQQEQQEQQEND
ncbi:TraX protein [compost metagenome]